MHGIEKITDRIIRDSEAEITAMMAETEEKILARLARTREELKDLGIYDYVVYNRDGEVNEAAEDILAIVRAEKLSLSRNPDAEKKYFEN